MRIIRFCVALILLCAAFAPASAQEKYPNRPVKFVVSFAAGGSNDIIARVLCDWLSEHFGQQFVVENRPGGSGNVGDNNGGNVGGGGGSNRDVCVLQQQAPEPGSLALLGIALSGLALVRARRRRG